MDILITCPPMLITADHARSLCREQGWNAHCADVVQTLDESQLVDLVPRFDGWIAGDDPATRNVLQHARRGRLKALVKWGVGVDSVDQAACRELGIGFANTPGMFSDEVADVAMAYLITLTRQIHRVHEAVVEGRWVKPQGRSLRGKRAALVGYGNIGRAIADRLAVCGVETTIYDPQLDARAAGGAARWPDGISDCDFVILSCALTEDNRHLLGSDVLTRLKPGVMIVNVSRGPLIDESALAEALAQGRVAAVALDVFETEPLPDDSPLRAFPQCLFGSHNASNTLEAVRRTNEAAVSHLADLLDQQ